MDGGAELGHEKVDQTERETKLQTIPDSPIHIYDGKVAISPLKQVPEAVLHVFGAIIATDGIRQTCDETTKQNIELLESNEMLQQVLKMKPASFEYKHLPEEEKLGFLARQLEEINPKLVHKDSTGKYSGSQHFSAL